ncbi:hypothetical protein BZG36_04472 [Bifiguratus adelaidae]|uniref:Enhancer of polycomb-like protein n=1 Tax=Bifiguratus adelaidae TaxID=1938954 RepID=A0A261XVG3_9FUNG|nr:hypothetical protein BZG36_04472 [Bifiguratus adelaidae]
MPPRAPPPLIPPRFRSRKLSPSQRLAIYQAWELPDVNEASCAVLGRTVDAVETGVDKEEEELRDLAQVLATGYLKPASNAAVTTGEVTPQLYIPTPDASKCIEDERYKSLYERRKFTQPSTFIRYSSTLEDASCVDYCMDEVDEKWLTTFNQKQAHNKSTRLSENDFERLMSQFEQIADERVPFLHMDPSDIPSHTELLCDFPKDFTPLLPFAEHIYTHWKHRRITRAGRPINPTLKLDETARNESDPYVCFRRRETKPIRKTRRSDQLTVERLSRLRKDLQTALSLVHMVVKRERARKECLQNEVVLFQKRLQLYEMQKSLGISETAILIPPVIKTKHEGSTTIKIPLGRVRREEETRSNAAIEQAAYERELVHRREQNARYEDVTENPYHPFLQSTPHQYYRSIQFADSPNVSTYRQPSYRRRVGRGGRLFIDRRVPRELLSFSATDWDDDQAVRSQHNQFDFDDDGESDDEAIEYDYWHSRTVDYRCGLLKEPDLRNLVTTPFHLRIQHPEAFLRRAQSQAVSHITPVNSHHLRTPPATPPPAQLASPRLVNQPPKRQSSNTKLTPDQQSVNMATGMVVKGLQLAAERAQRAAIANAMRQEGMIPNTAALQPNQGPTLGTGESTPTDSTIPSPNSQSVNVRGHSIRVEPPTPQSQQQLQQQLQQRALATQLALQREMLSSNRIPGANPSIIPLNIPNGAVFNGSTIAPISTPNGLTPPLSSTVTPIPAPYNITQSLNGNVTPTSNGRTPSRSPLATTQLGMAEMTNKDKVRDRREGVEARA